jgi:hypothetical protein
MRIWDVHPGYLNRQSLRLWLFFAAAILVLLLAFNAFYAYQNYRQLQILDERFAELRGEPGESSGATTDFSAKKYAAVKDEVEFANEIVSADQFRWTALLDRLEILTPSDVRIVSAQPNFKNGALQLSCRAKDVTAMTGFIDALLNSEDMNKAFLKNHGEVETQQNGFKESEVTFSLSIEEAF